MNCYLAQGKAIDHEKVLELLPYIHDEAEKEYGCKLRRVSVKWEYIDRTVEFKIVYVSDTEETEGLGY